jgi:hypothetical protein
VAFLIELRYFIIIRNGYADRISFRGSAITDQIRMIDRLEGLFLVQHQRKLSMQTVLERGLILISVRLHGVFGAQYRELQLRIRGGVKK